MSDLSGGRVTLDVQREWNASLMQTSALRPAGSHALLLGWTVDPPFDDGGMPSAVAAGIARGLAEYGLVAGRWFDEPAPAGDLRFMPAPSRGIGRRLIDRLTHNWPADLVATRSPQVVYQLFEQGWWMQYQILLVLDPAAETVTAVAFEALRTLRNWSEFDLPPPVLALIAPGVDGDVVLLAAASEARLSSLLDALRPSLLASGISLPAAGPV